jgi:transposase-like protein
MAKGKRVRREFSEDFKVQVVKESIMVLEAGGTLADVAAKHELNYGLLAQWRDRYQERAKAEMEVASKLGHGTGVRGELIPMGQPTGMTPREAYEAAQAKMEEEEEEIKEKENGKSPWILTWHPAADKPETNKVFHTKDEAVKAYLALAEGLERQLWRCSPVDVVIQVKTR